MQPSFCGPASTNACCSTRQQADSAISALQGCLFFGRNISANWPTHDKNEAPAPNAPPKDLRESLGSPDAGAADDEAKRARDAGAAASSAGTAVELPAAKRQNTGAARIVVVESATEAPQAAAASPAPVEAVDVAPTRGGRGGRGRGRGKGKA